MPGYKVYVQENDGEVREGLKCFFCKLLLKDPVQSSETGQRYCKDCFSEVVAIRFVMSRLYSISILVDVVAMLQFVRLLCFRVVCFSVCALNYITSVQTVK